MVTPLLFQSNSYALRVLFLVVLHLEKGLLLLLDPNIVVPALPSWGFSLSQLAGGNLRSVFSLGRA